MLGLRYLSFLVVALCIANAPAAGEDTPAEGISLGAEAAGKLRDDQKQSRQPDQYRQREIRPNGSGGADGVIFHSGDVYVGRLKRSISPFHAATSPWVFHEGVYTKANGDRYQGRFHFFHENWGEDHNMNQEDWAVPFVGRYILVGSYIPKGGNPQNGIFGAEIFGDRPIAFAPADGAYLAQFERRYQSQVTAFKRAQMEEAESGRSFGQVLALGLGAAMLSVADIPSADALTIGGALATDVLTGGDTDALGSVLEAQRQNSPPSVGGAAGGTSTAEAGYTTEQVTISCPSGVSSTIPISYKTRQCRSAMIGFAEVYSCNLIDDFAKASQACSSACGDPQCRQ